MDLIVAKGIAVALLFLIPILMGALPLTLPLCPFIRSRLQHVNTKSFFSYLNCFAGGFFLGTCLLVVLGQGISKFESYKHLVNLKYTFPFFEVGIGVGFFLVALTEKLIHLTCAHRPHRGVKEKKKKKKKKEEEEEEEAKRVQEMTQRSSTTMIESDDDLVEVADYSDAVSTKNILSDMLRSKSSRGHDLDEPEQGSKGSNPTSADSHVQNSDETTKEASQAKAQSAGDEGASEFSLLRVLLLLIALSFHTIFDGLALGLLNEVSEVTSLMAALAIHKAIMSFVLGMELAAAFGEQTLSLPLLALLLYSLASPLGVAIGIGVTAVYVHQPAELLTGAVLQAVATGVFLYVTCFEILARDMVARQDAALLRLLTAVLGFIVLTALETAVSL